MAHINHAGRVANPKLISQGDLVSASDVTCPANGVTPRSLTRAEIAAVVAEFAAAAQRARAAGFDALELPFSHGYLIHQFLSPHTNRRRDEYGGNLENRMRFGREVVDAVRHELDGELPLVVRMNATDYVEGGLTVDDALRIARMVESIGVDALSITSGTMCESVPFCLYPTGTPKANLLPMAGQIRATVVVPVIVAGRIRTPTTARQALLAGQTDLVGLARPLLADPDWVEKCERSDEESILLCAACHQGCLAELRKGHGTGCAFNPTTGHEAEEALHPAKRARNVMVVGGGPGGLEAARVAAQRGHRVTLFEKEHWLGGQLRLAASPPYKEGFLDVIRFLELMARRAGVEVYTDSEVTREVVQATGPDVVVLSTGGVPLTVPFPGLDQTRWLLSSDLLDGVVKVQTSSALVIGGGLAGLEAADFLAAQGKQVTLIEMLGEVGKSMDPLAKAMIIRRLDQRGVVVHTGAKVVRLTADTATAEREGQEFAIACETVVLAVGVRANRALAEALSESAQEFHVIGDAVEPRMASDAIREGFAIGCQL
jgi:2,4-dienoyl-CoA reductase-like NADH-dependent reductase (Old Yellow Enzyme family)/thioredoxin reductase